MPHSEDLDAHIKSVFEDAGYWGAKRLEARIFRLIRKDKISFFEILKASQEILKTFAEPRLEGDLEEQIASLEFRLGDFIRGVSIASSLTSELLPTDEFREENGTYYASFKFEHQPLSGTMEEQISQLSKVLAEYQALLQALLQVLVNRGAIREIRLQEMLSAKVAPRYENGARIVAKAWVDPTFKKRLLSDAKSTLRELDFALNRTPKLVVVENEAALHNVIVCTLCSCYPYELLGNPPWWYKNDVYKEAIIRNPRKVLADMFHFKVPEEIEVRVFDSTSDIRYMVLPSRPKGTEALSEEELAKLVTEDSLIGVGDVLKPQAIMQTKAAT